MYLDTDTILQCILYLYLDTNFAKYLYMYLDTFKKYLTQHCK
jgi:hypothetical protein